MKKLYVWLISVGLLIIVATGCLWIWAERYVATTTIPPDVKLSSWAVGGMEIDQFQQEYNHKLAQLEAIPILFTFSPTEVAPVSTTLKQIGVTYEADDLFQALAKLKEGSLYDRIRYRMNFPTDWRMGFTWDSKVWTQRLTPSWEEQTFGHPTNATRAINNQDQVIYTPGKQVFRLDRIQLEQLIRVAIPNEWSDKQEITIEVPLVSKEADITVETLKEDGIERKIIEMVTPIKPGDEGRIHNIEAAADTINDMILKPGEIFDYDKVIAEAERKYGFKEAPVILNGKLVPGIGGGICQVSSTLYNAALRTGLEIVERRNHSLPVAYLPLGLDATFSQGYLNFRFKNTTGKNILIRSSTDNDRLTIKLFGTMDPTVSYKMETKTIKIIQPTVKYVVNTSLPAGSQQILQEGKVGYQVESYRIKLINDKEVSREKLATDTYKAQPTLIATHAKDAKPEANPVHPTPIIEDGIIAPTFP